MTDLEAGPLTVDRLKRENEDLKRLNEFKDRLIWQSRVSQLYEDLVATEKRSAELLTALKKLAVEVSGAFGIADEGLRAALGNTNAQVLYQRWEEAKAVIAKVEGLAAR